MSKVQSKYTIKFKTMREIT